MVHHRSQKGSVLLEFCICLGLLVFLTFSAVSLGLAMREHATVVEAARVGGRAASMLLPGASPEVITETALISAGRYLEASGYASGNYSFQVVPRTVELTHSGEAHIMRLNVARRENAVYDFITGLTFAASARTEFPLAHGNAAVAFDSEVGSGGN